MNREFNKTFEVQLGKSNYVLLEPMWAKFKYTPLPGESNFNILQAISIRVKFRLIIREFQSLTAVVTSGEPLPAPIPKNQILLGKDKSNESNFYIQEGIIDRVKEFFPEPGNYQIQFYWGGRMSNLIDVIIEEPTGINSQAFKFLNNFESPLLFNWAWDRKDGISLLESFVNNYGQSAYGELAIEKLASIYFVKNEFDKAQKEYKKLLLSNKAIITKEAIKHLADIEKIKTSIKKTRQPQ